MRILFFALDIDLSLPRGDSIHAFSLASALARAGHPVHMVVGSAKGAVSADGFEFSVRPDEGDFRVLRHAQQVVRRFRPDVIYERRFSPKISAALSLLIRKPYVVEYNGILDEEAAIQGRPIPVTPRWRLKASLRMFMLRRAAAVVTVTERLREIVVSEYGVRASRVFLVENGVDPGLFRPMDRIVAREALGLRAGPVVCFVGNLVGWQGIGVLLEAIKTIHESVRVILVGDGPDKQQLVDRARRLEVLAKVEFIGSVPHGSVPLYIAASDVCVAPFTARRNERSGVSPLKLYEYIACARPVVVSGIAGARELVERTGCGMVVPPDDPRALGSAIDQVLQDPTFVAAAKRAGETVRRERSWDSVAASVSRVLRSVTDAHKLPTDSIIREGPGQL